MGFLKEIAAVLYGAGVGLRNRLYDLKILRSTQFDIPIVCVGNVAVGGTGKTPTVEFLVKNLSGQYNVAVLSRGYRRRTKGYIEVQVSDSFLTVGDEAKQIKRKFPEAVVVVCEKRVKAVRRIMEEHPEVNLIIMDDGFQHRSLTPKVSIVLSDYNVPPFRNKMLPAGTLRDSPSQLYRANILLITKTPKTMSPIERNIAQKELKATAATPVEQKTTTGTSPTVRSPLLPTRHNSPWAIQSSLHMKTSLWGPTPATTATRPT